jgi:hypothetical protein
MTGDRDLSSTNSPLVNYALKGLEKCWLPQHGRWSHIYHLDGRATPNESLPHSDVFYTLNVLLGLSRVTHVPSNIDLQETFRRNAASLTSLPASKYAFGMALWASAELKLEMPGNVLDAIKRLLADRNNWPAFRAQDIGMLLIGVVAQAKFEETPWSQLATELFDFLVEKYHCDSGLFFNATSGLRRPFATFASQTYLTLACYVYGEYAANARAVDLANKCTETLIALQGPNGEWPWFFHVPSGSVSDFYEIYSVHQYGMAPAFLEHAERMRVERARDALIKGFRWVLGENPLRKIMLVPELSLSIRSQVRKGELNTKQWRALRAVRSTLFPTRGTLTDPANVELRLECRSYELGWILWSFGQRTDLPQLSHHQTFASTLKQPDAVLA